MIFFSSIFLYFYMMADGLDARLDVLSQIETQLVEIVHDDTRQAKTIEVIEQMKATVQTQHDDYNVIQAKYLKLNADYNADMQQYESLDNKVDAFWHGTMRKQVELRFTLREQLTREEWNKLYKEIN